MNRGVADQEKEVGKKGPDPGLVTSSSNSGAEGQGCPEEKGTMSRGERRMRIKPVI